MIIGKTATEIFASVRQQIESGVLKPGETLPPVRDLAAVLAVNRNTVAAAYKRLVACGLALSQGRNGTLIKGAAPPAALEGGDPDTPLTDLSGGNPHPQRLPDYRRYLSALSGATHLYGDAAVDPRLAAWAEAWMQADLPGPGEINVAGGAIDAIERLLCGQLLPGDGVAVEDPCFLSSINMLRYAGFQACPVPVDGEGMQAPALEEELRKGARAVILTPRAHNPTGCSLSQPRAREIFQLLTRYPQAMVILDDHFALLSTAQWQPIIPPSTQRWALVRSLSKTLGPDLRLALIASDAVTSAALRQRLNAGSHWVSHLLQRLALACLTDNGFMRTLAESRRFYQRQNASLAEALTRRGVVGVCAGDGLNLWLPLPGDSQPVAFRLARAGWLAREGEPFGIRAASHGLRLSVAALDDNDIEKLADDLRQAIAHCFQE